MPFPILLIYNRDMPPVKVLRLTKSKADGLASKSPDSSPSPDNNEVTFKASFEDLRSPNGRQSLRQHFTGAFPETHRKSSYGSVNNYDMGMKSRLSRTSSNLSVAPNETAESSTLSVNTVGSAKRLSTVQETNAAIDIEQAIRLLQELKKLASPEELVALHKALLPTRDSALASPSLPVNEQEPSASTASLIRHRSMLPPGLATRGGAGEDILRRQEDIPILKKLKKQQSDDWSPLSERPSQSNLAALDLADDAAHPRAATPSDMQMGVYRPGTLRITNGAASPEPFIPVPGRRSIEVHSAEVRIGDSVEQRASQDYATAPTTPEDRVSQEFQPARSSLRESLPMPDAHNTSQQTSSRRQSEGDRRSRDPSQSRKYRSSRSRDQSISGIPVPQDRDESTPRIYKRARPKRSRADSRSSMTQSQDESQNRPGHKRDSSVSYIPLRIETPRHSLNVVEPQLSMQSFSSPEPQLSKQSLRAPLEQRVSAQSLRPLRPEIDDGRVSPIATDLPRYAQRWSHRASKLAEDYNSDSESSANPYHDIKTLRTYEDRASLLKRLSTVYDGGDDEDAIARETPEAALSRLNGNETNRPVQQLIEMRSASTSDRAAPSPHVYSNTRLERPMPPQKADSGYGTDNSPQASQQKLSREAGTVKKPHQMLDDLNSLDDDGKSLYTFDQVLKSPSLLAGLSTPSPPPSGASKKHSSFLKLASSKRGSSSVSPIVNDSFGTDELVESSPNEPQSPKKKKLQKRMPESVRKERKAQMKQKQQEGSGSQVTVGECPSILDEIATSPLRFSFEPSLAPASRSSISLAPSELQADVQPPPVELNASSEAVAVSDETATSRLSFLKLRSRSRGRSRERSTSLQIATSEKEVVSQETDDASRGGSKSGNTTPKQSVFDLGPISRKAGATKDDASDEDIPLWTDHASVSRALGSSPYDMSTQLFKRTVTLPSAAMHQIQSPHQISTSFSRTKSGHLRGMDSGMASELARLKSRDVALQNNEEVYDRPRMAKPKSRSEERSRSRGASRVPLMLEDRFPDGRGRLTAANLSSEPAELSAKRLSTYSESIPPMPELPADVQVRMIKMDELVVKRLRDSAQPTPTVSERSSEERPGDSKLSVADAVKKAVDARKAQEVKQNEESRRSARSRSAGRRKAKKASPQLQARELLSSSSEESVKAPQNAKVTKDDGQSPSLGQSQGESGSVDWEQHAKSWRERRRTLGESLGEPVSTKYDTTSSDEPVSQSESSDSPAGVVSRNITPRGSRQDATGSALRGRTLSASQHASAYRLLIGEEADSREVEDDEPYHVTSPQTPSSQIERARSPGGRVITPSGNFHPYTPAAAVHAERSRTESLAKLEGAAVTKSSQPPNISQPSPVPQKNAIESLFDRYSGGLEYNYERGVGFSGSAGTRGQAEGAPRKSKELSEGYGLDLSDVPMFLRKLR